MNTNMFVIDFTAFTTRDKSAIVKELTIIDVDSRCVQHLVFKPPKDSAFWDTRTGRQNQWFSMHHHGLEYYDGSGDYDNMASDVRSICTDAAFIFAPTQEKAAWLENNLFDKSRVVFNLELFGCPPALYSKDTLLFPIKDEKYQCLLHQIRAPGFYCTQSSVKVLADWCAENKDKLDMDQVCNREKSFAAWSHLKPTPLELATEGFVKFSSSDDMTRCVYCNIDLHKWIEGDSPSKDHEKFSSFCDVVRERQDAETAAKMIKAGLQCDCGRCFQPKEDRESEPRA